MKQIILIFVSIFVLISFLNAKSSIELKKHEVQPGQTLFFISKLYDVSIDDIRKTNPEIENDLIIRPGQILKIEQNIALDETPKDVKYVKHVVQSKETLYSISKQYNVGVDEIIRMNQLETPAIQVGQLLRVKEIKLEKEAIYAPEMLSKKEIEKVKAEKEITVDKKDAVKFKDTPKDPIPENTVSKTDSDLLKMLFDGYDTNVYTMKKEKGIGNFLEQDQNNVYLALVDGVKKDAVIRVRNLMNNKVVYLKVIGKLSPKDLEKNVSLKISKAAANDLNIIEDRFLAEWSWYEANPNTKETEQKDPVFFDDF